MCISNLAINEKGLIFQPSHLFRLSYVNEDMLREQYLQI